MANSGDVCSQQLGALSLCLDVAGNAARQTDRDAGRRPYRPRATASRPQGNRDARRTIASETTARRGGADVPSRGGPPIVVSRSSAACHSSGGSSAHVDFGGLLVHEPHSLGTRLEHLLFKLKDPFDVGEPYSRGAGQNPNVRGRTGFAAAVRVPAQNRQLAIGIVAHDFQQRARPWPAK